MGLQFTLSLEGPLKKAFHPRGTGFSLCMFERNFRGDLTLRSAGIPTGFSL